MSLPESPLNQSPKRHNSMAVSVSSPLAAEGSVIANTIPELEEDEDADDQDLDIHDVLSESPLFSPRSPWNEFDVYAAFQRHSRSEQVWAYSTLL
jgi:hypothetical protein